MCSFIHFTNILWHQRISSQKIRPLWRNIIIAANQYNKIFSRHYNTTNTKKMRQQTKLHYRLLHGLWNVKLKMQLLNYWIQRFIFQNSFYSRSRLSSFNGKETWFLMGRLIQFTYYLPFCWYKDFLVKAFHWQYFCLNVQSYFRTY